MRIEKTTPRLHTRILAPLLFLVFLGACDSATDVEDRLLAKSVPSSSVSGNKGNLLASKDPMVLVSQKLQPYVKCINTVSSRVSAAKSRYLSWVKNKIKGPTCKERYISYATYKLYSTTACTTALLKANKKPPHLAKLEKAAAGFAQAVSRLKPLLDSAYLYYTTKAYKRDNCAKGKQLHPRLMATWEVASGYDIALRQAVRSHNEKIQGWRLARIAKRYGLNHPRYYHRKIMAHAKESLATMRRLFFSKGKARTGNELADARAATRRYGDLVEKAGGLSKAGVRVVGYTLYKIRAKALAKAFVEAINRKSKKKGYTRLQRRWLRSPTTGHLVKGSFARVLKRFNELIGAFNRVRFSA
ncbi:MAG: YiiG family protein [Deltaproteobacteria bacterium]|nr:YiiG family protein [Deltaproteobacteria bacterium]